MSPTSSRTFTAVVNRDAQGRVVIPLPFDPSDAWGPRAQYHITGMVGARRVRGPLAGSGPGAQLVLGGAWCRDGGLVDGETVEVVLAPEGPQRDGLAPDIVAALDGNPAAAAFWDALATFYRKGYLSWVDATKKRPDVRAARIAELVDLLAAGKKERPS